MSLTSPIRIFLFLTLLSLVGLVYVTNEKNEFFNNPLSDEILQKIDTKTSQLEKITYQKFGVEVKIPILIADSIPNNLFGVARIKNDGEISIILNKNRFKENEQYMIDSVLPHEYAHALMFVFGDFSNEDGGHTQKWQEICNQLGGKKCERYVGDDDILIEKIGFMK